MMFLALWGVISLFTTPVLFHALVKAKQELKAEKAKKNPTILHG